MVDQDDGFSFFLGNHVRIDVRIHIPISVNPMTTKFGKQVHLDDMTQIS